MPESPQSQRRRADYASLQSLQTEYRNAVRVLAAQGDPPFEIEVEFRVRTAENCDFPRQYQPATRAKIELGPRYPFDPPRVTITTPIYNPNIFPSGLVCLGQRWLPTENLGLLARRILQIIALDPQIINLASPANRDAANWYRTQRHATPSAFPTVDLNSLRAPPPLAMTWRTIK